MKTSENRMEVPDMNPHIYAHLSFDKNHPKHAIENRQPFQQILLGKLNICMQKTERSMSFTLYKYQPIRPKTLKLV
jgi:hypothetical protein